jgi:hypothetical protein
MRILDRSVYVGPSLYARFPVIRLELDLEALEAWPTGKLGAQFVDALAGALPGLAEHGCSYREPGGFFRRMSPSSCKILPAKRLPSARPAAPVLQASIPSSTSTRNGTKASRQVIWDFGCFVPCFRPPFARRIQFPTAGTGRKRAMSSFDLRSGVHWAPRHPRWCARPNTAASPGFG